MSYDAKQIVIPRFRRTMTEMRLEQRCIAHNGTRAVPKRRTAPVYVSFLMGRRAALNFRHNSPGFAKTFLTLQRLGSRFVTTLEADHVKTGCVPKGRVRRHGN
jgi:hypothetical protein